MDASLASESFEPALAHATSDARPSLTMFKAHGPRAGALVIDWLILYAIVFLAGFAVEPLAKLAGAMGFEVVSGEPTASLTARLPSLALNTLYFVVFEIVCGATPAKALLKMRVVMVDGRPVRPWSTLVRGLARWVPDGFFFGAMAASSMSASPTKQRYGDKWAHTVVVDSRDPGILVRRGSARFLLASLACLILGLPLMWQVFDLEIVPLPQPIVAADANLTVAELAQLGDGSFTLAADYDLAHLGLPSASDANFRVFVGETAIIGSMIAVFPGRLGDDEESLRALASGYIDEETTTSGTATKQPAQSIDLGDLAVIQDFKIDNDQTRGTVLVFRVHNRFVRFFISDNSGLATTQRALQLGETIARRLR